MRNATKTLAVVALTLSLSGKSLGSGDQEEKQDTVNDQKNSERKGFNDYGIQSKSMRAFIEGSEDFLYIPRNDQETRHEYQSLIYEALGLDFKTDGYFHPTFREYVEQYQISRRISLPSRYDFRIRRETLMSLLDEKPLVEDTHLAELPSKLWFSGLPAEMQRNYVEHYRSSHSVNQVNLEHITKAKSFRTLTSEEKQQLLQIIFQTNSEASILKICQTCDQENQELSLLIEHPDGGTILSNIHAYCMMDLPPAFTFLRPNVVYDTLKCFIHPSLDPTPLLIPHDEHLRSLPKEVRRESWFISASAEWKKGFAQEFLVSGSPKKYTTTTDLIWRNSAHTTTLIS